jgi:hypothetical protein
VRQTLRREFIAATTMLAAVMAWGGVGALVFMTASPEPSA